MCLKGHYYIVSTLLLPKAFYLPVLLPPFGVQIHCTAVISKNFLNMFFCQEHYFLYLIFFFLRVFFDLMILVAELLFPSWKYLIHRKYFVSLNHYPVFFCSVLENDNMEYNRKVIACMNLEPKDKYSSSSNIISWLTESYLCLHAS